MSWEEIQKAERNVVLIREEPGGCGHILRTIVALIGTVIGIVFVLITSVLLVAAWAKPETGHMLDNMLDFTLEMVEEISDGDIDTTKTSNDKALYATFRGWTLGMMLLILCWGGTAIARLFGVKRSGHPLGALFDHSKHWNEPGPY